MKTEEDMYVCMYNVRDSRYRDSRYTLSANSNDLIVTPQQENKYLLCLYSIFKLF